MCNISCLMPAEVGRGIGLPGPGGIVVSHHMGPESKLGPLQVQALLATEPLLQPPNISTPIAVSSSSFLPFQLLPDMAAGISYHRLCPQK